jgi:plastocyanin
MIAMRFRFPAMLAATLLFSPLAHAQNGGMTMSNHHILRIDITMSNFAYAPSRIDMPAGSEVQLHLINTSSSGHDFSAPELFAAGTIAPEDRAKVSDGGIEVEGGETIDVRFTPTKPGTYEIRCTHFLHTSFGMKGTAVVQ